MGARRIRLDGVIINPPMAVFFIRRQADKMSDTAIALISVAGIICAIIFGYIALVRNRRKDSTDEGQNKRRYAH